MSPLTPQHTELDNSWMSSDPILVRRTQSPSIEVFEEGEEPSRRETNERDALIDPCMAFKAMNDFLESLQQQWLEYGYGPKGFDNHGVNPSVHHAEELERYRRALAAKSTSRTTTPDVKPMLKREETIPHFWPGMLVRRENLPFERADALRRRGGFAPNMPDRPAYFSRWHEIAPLQPETLLEKTGIIPLEEIIELKWPRICMAEMNMEEDLLEEMKMEAVLPNEITMGETSLVKDSLGVVPLMVVLQEEDPLVVMTRRKRMRTVLEDMGELP
ncbi:hypothetical protein PISMIDRAFT_17209 [Pisolithus microcarpus 441]|uniref:Uncharacterized protein n=1 Tax=Pisolithus microcarpus 441 TaxID=765257 RepID=A0A0C9YCZ7_9AGAM|nr:hypothetical protein PISMIDRAFT_17209 [Pisolithus microcarpus 441]